VLSILHARQSDNLWPALAYLTDLLKSPLPGSGRSVRPFSHRWYSSPASTCLTNVGTAGGFPSLCLVLLHSDTHDLRTDFLQILLSCHYCAGFDQRSLHANDGIIYLHYRAL
jgi:hypothetical protein